MPDNVPPLTPAEEAALARVHDELAAQRNAAKERGEPVPENDLTPLATRKKPRGKA